MRCKWDHHSGNAGVVVEDHGLHLLCVQSLGDSACGRGLPDQRAWKERNKNARNTTCEKRQEGNTPGNTPWWWRHVGSSVDYVLFARAQVLGFISHLILIRQQWVRHGMWCQKACVQSPALHLPAVPRSATCSTSLNITSMSVRWG